MYLLTTTKYAASILLGAHTRRTRGKLELKNSMVRWPTEYSILYGDLVNPRHGLDAGRWNQHYASCVISREYAYEIMMFTVHRASLSTSPNLHDTLRLAILAWALEMKTPKLRLHHDFFQLDIFYQGVYIFKLGVENEKWKRTCGHDRAYPSVDLKASGSLSQSRYFPR
jgi:hypothetical protein